MAKNIAPNAQDHFRSNIFYLGLILSQKMLAK